jgi:hypothetical protein
MDVQRMVKAYIKIRDKRAEIKKEFEEQDKALKEKLELIESEMLRHMQETGIESIKTAAGTFYRQEEVTPTGSDWDAFYTWVKTNDAFDALERRIKKGFIKEYMETHEGGIPPGVSVYREYVVRVRRS